MFRFLVDGAEHFITANDEDVVEARQATLAADYPYHILSFAAIDAYSNVDLQNLRVAKTPGMVVAATVTLPRDPSPKFWNNAARKITYYLSRYRAFCVDDREILFFEHPLIAVTINQKHAQGTSDLQDCPHHILTYDVFDVYSNDRTLRNLRANTGVKYTDVTTNTYDEDSKAWDVSNSKFCDVIVASLQTRHEFSLNKGILRFYKRAEKYREPVRARLDSEITALKRELSSLLMRTADLM